MELYNRLCTITKQENVMKDEPMKKHTTFRIGGPADYFVTPESKEEIQAIVELCKKEEIPYSVIGNGSNLLVGDKGYRGVILQIFKKMNQIRVEENKIYAGAGALLSKIAATALSESLTGFVSLYGISIGFKRVKGFCLCRRNSGNIRRSRSHECGCIRWRDEAGS